MTSFGRLIIGPPGNPRSSSTEQRFLNGSGSGSEILLQIWPPERGGQVVDVAIIKRRAAINEKGKGDFIRIVRGAGGPTTALIKQFIDAGKLVPDGFVVRLLKDAMETTIRSTGYTIFLLAAAMIWSTRYRSIDEQFELPLQNDR